MTAKTLWQAGNAALLILYASAVVLIASGHAGHWCVILAGVVLVAHVLEIPLAMKVLKQRKPALGRLVVGTLLFGFLWWVPARQGLYRC